MAHVFRPMTVKSIPANATVVKVGGKLVAKWTARGGRTVKADVTPDGTRCRYEGATYYVQYVDAHGVKRKVKGFKDYNATLQKGLDLEKRADAVRAGKDVAHEAEGVTHMADHLDLYRDHRRRECKSAKHVYEAVEYVRKILDGARLTTPGAVDCEKLAAWLDFERERVGPGKKRWSQRTLNHRIAKLKAFGNFLVAKKKATYNPFAGLEGGDAERDRKRIRRAIDHADLLRLVATARDSAEVVCKLGGVDRSMLYLIGATTGLRMGSLARLRPESFNWIDGQPVSVFSRLNKNGKPVGIPLHPDIGAAIAAWLRTKPAGQPLWQGGKTWAMWGAKMLRHDLAAADIPYVDAAGEYYDFHSLRVQYGSSLARAGVPLSAAQDLLDHSDPKLTKAVYTRWGRGELAAEVAKLPGLRTTG